MGRKSISADRRKEILSAFKDVIRSEGIEGASIGKLAKFMDIPPSLIMHYFHSKDELVKCVASVIIEETYDNLISQIDQLPQNNTAERLVNFLFGIEWQKKFDVFFYRLINYLAVSSDEISNELQNKFNLVVLKIADYLGVENNSNPITIHEVEETSSLLLSSSLGFMEFEILRNDQSVFFKNSRVIKNYWLKAIKS